MRVSGSSKKKTPNSPQQEHIAEPVEEIAESVPRTVLLHYHLFKNAGTSLDEVLKSNFGESWVTREFERIAPRAHQRELIGWIESNPEAVVFSSHTIEVPPPKIAGVKIIPLIFVRHPIDRVASCYAFERKQGGSGFGAVLARNTTLAGYTEVRLSMPRDRQCRDFHVERLANLHMDDALSELQCAHAALEELPFVGIVEDFAGSMDRLTAVIQDDFPAFKPKTVTANVSRSVGKSLEDKLKDLRAELGEALFTALEKANVNDMALYQKAVEKALL